jgi:hypothetical protein
MIKYRARGYRNEGRFEAAILIPLRRTGPLPDPLEVLKRQKKLWSVGEFRIGCCSYVSSLAGMVAFGYFIWRFGALAAGGLRCA